MNEGDVVLCTKKVSLAYHGCVNDWHAGQIHPRSHTPMIGQKAYTPDGVGDLHTGIETHRHQPEQHDALTEQHDALTDSVFRRKSSFGKHHVATVYDVAWKNHA